MCGYNELLTPCCHEKTGFSPTIKCTLYFQNNRYCRTGSIHSWILYSPSLTSRILCDNCKRIDDHKIKEIEREIEERRKAEEEGRRGEEARGLRALDKEIKRRSDERREERQSAAAALRSQFAGMEIEDGGEGPSASRK
ncbi:hypothetical protein D6C84_10275 [Aureobasidium pullulans]|uniref:Uncharacterized protein n=1 Tax=Aureobasidium pullulans TaxID=5580 RepID=A0A4S9WYK3_AURPU|nr:hypothetical protein D6C84_10275 [Aureobasidium pullulans]